MPSTLLRRATLAAALPILLGTATAGTALARPTTATRVDPAAPRAGAPPKTAAPSALTLVNGDRLLTGSDANGRRSTVVLNAPGSGLSSSLVTLRSGSKELVIPWAALPYVGRSLDPRLFEVGALQRAEREGRLPITIRYAGHRPALPGITVTSQALGLEQGYLTASSARAFGAALARQMISDHSRGSYGTDGLFAGGVSISLPGPAPAHARPNFKMHTLTVNATNLAGKPDTGDTVLVFNVHNADVFGAGFGDLSVFDHGTAKFSAPSGTYWAVSLFNSTFNHGRSVSVHMDVLPQFTIAGDTTVRMRARAATSEITMVTPRPAIAQSRELDIIRSGRGAVNGFGVDDLGRGDQFWVSPVSQRPSDGTLQAFTSGQLSSPPSRGIPYFYALNFANPRGIISPQHFVARPADLATLSERYYQDVPSLGGWTIFGGTALQLRHTIPSSSVYPLRLPGRQVQYLSARPAMLWQRTYYEFAGPQVNGFLAGPLAGGQNAPYRLVHAGQHRTENWNRYPLHTATNAIAPGSGLFPVVPSAVRAGNNLLLDITPFGDNEPGHIGSGFMNGLFGRVGKITGSWAVFQDGVKLAGGDAVKDAEGAANLALEGAVKSRPSLIRFVLTASRTGKRYRLSTWSRDVWTWRSQPEPHAVVPAPWLCGITPSHRAVRRCAVQQMLTLNYWVGGLSLAGTAPAGRQVLDLTVGHLQQAAQSRVIRAGLRFSVNGGRTWQRASIRSAGAGRFRAQFTVPRSSEVTLQVTARDATGATITETIRSAYRISA
ncbi:MAG TPA: hypothetical protein VFI65_02200 [Streptosporangiaceae bacterium]|nr:hypothetical protein [Streptosporangiaceae bacterium]